MAAESVAEMAVPIYVIGLDADTAQIERSGDFAAIERGGPPTMIGFEQQIAVVRPPRQIHQLVLVWRLRAASVARCSRQGFGQRRARVLFEAGILVDKRVHASQRPSPMVDDKSRSCRGVPQVATNSARAAESVDLFNYADACKS